MTEDLIRQQQAIQHLLDPHSASDALFAYYALYHPADRSTLVLHYGPNGRTDGFVALCRTGIDLFRPLVALKAPSIESAVALLATAVPPEASVILAAPAELRPAVEAAFATSGESVAEIYKLDRGRFQPIINVLVTRAPSPGGDPRFVIRGQSFDRGARPVGPALATAGVNWRSPDYADIYVHTDPQVRGRGLGKSVVAALVNWLLEQDVTPLYSVARENEQSLRVAAALGFQPTGTLLFFCDGVRRPAFPLPKSVVE